MGNSQAAASQPKGRAKISGWRLFAYSLGLGIGYYRRSPERLLHREALRRILTPINVSRVYEFLRTCDSLKPRPGELVFDLSSPKLLSHYLQEKIGCRVVVSDINSEEVHGWTSLTRHRKVRPRWLMIDGMKIGIKDDIFDKIYSISVLEHIAGDGDASTLRELERILKPGGRLIFTVPYAAEHRSESASTDAYDLYNSNSGSFHWSHFYSETSIREKLLKKSSLELESLYFACGTGSNIWKKIERLGRFGFPFWIFSPSIARYGITELDRQPSGTNEDNFLAAVAVLTKKKRDERVKDQ